MLSYRVLRIVSEYGMAALGKSSEIPVRCALALAVLAFLVTPSAALATPQEGPSGNVAGCPALPDTDGDGVGDACDNCPDTFGQTRNPSDFVDQSIPDHGSGCGNITTGLARTITLNEDGVVSNLKLVLDIEHFAYSDLNITLEHNGTAVTVEPFETTSTNNRIGVRLNGTYVFDDAASTYFYSAAYDCFLDQDCTVLQQGTYRGVHDLAAFEGMDVKGDWTLTINDSCSQLAGYLSGWSLNLSIAYPDQFDFDYDGVGDLCDNCPDSTYSLGGFHDQIVPIPDGAPGTCGVATTGLTQTITIAERGHVAFIEMALDLQHDSYEDLDIQLEHNGTIVTLVSNDLTPPYITSNVGGTYTFVDYADETLDAAALSCFSTDCPVIPAGLYLGEESLTEFYGMDARGDWTLTIRDTCNLDTGTLWLWDLSLFIQDPDQTDTDGDGVGDICDLCATGQGRGDTEADGDLDLYDYKFMAACIQGVDGGLSPGCECFDFDGDGDVDFKDIRELALEYYPYPGCVIDGVFYEPGESDSLPFACRSCQPKISRKQWTISTAGAVCRPATGGCDIAELCSGTSTACPPDLIQPSNYDCRPAAGECDVAEFCSGLSTACPPDVLRPNNYECRAAAGLCDVAESCTGTSVLCPSDAFRPSSFVCDPETGPNGEYLCHDAVRCTGTTSACPFPTIVSYDPTRICRRSTAPCDPPEYCAAASTCAPDTRWNAGQECPGASACELLYTCDAIGYCNFNGYRAGTASCRAPVNDCDERDYCGSCPSSGPCTSPFPAGDPRNRIDFGDYPECGPDKKKPNGTTCAVGALAGTCLFGECVTITNCRYDIDCPDGYVCNGGSCVVTPVDHGFGDECIGKKFCDANSVNPGAFCAFPSDCQDAAHPGGNCVLGTRGDCVGNQDGHDLVCCVGMGGDGVGYTAAAGQKGRCQECCATNDYNDQTATGCKSTCCDGECTDTGSDPHNCGGCAYNGGVDCDKLRTGCTPTVEGCFSGECSMVSACYDPNDPFWIYDQCYMTETVSVPDPQCNFCSPALTIDPALHNVGCYTDADCGGVPGSCYIVNGRCSPDSAHPYEVCDPINLGDDQCWDATNTNGSCVASCLTLALVGGFPTLVHTYDTFVNTDVCKTPPFDGCSLSCRRDTSLCQSNNDPNDILPANYGAECDSDSDCHCGLTCQSSCDYSSGSNPIYFCFSPDTCQSP